MDDDTVLGGDIFQFLDELGVRKVGHLPSPKLRHAGKTEILDEDVVIAST